MTLMLTCGSPRWRTWTRMPVREHLVAEASACSTLLPSGIFFSKDRREEVIEVEEEPEYTVAGDGSRIPLMSQGDWMKGCPEGGEQGFLFGLYQQLSDGSVACPACSKHSIKRKKSDFFALYVS
jgi:hypothetical protein